MLRKHAIFAALAMALGFEALAGTAHAAPADNAAGEPIDLPSDAIIVTARKRPERLIDVPASISVVSAADIDKARLRAFSDITAVIPNVSFSGGIGGQLQGLLAIRGIATLVRNIGVESGVGIYVDGVYIGRPDTYNQEMLDVAQVEVLRGPQGTLFGKNTIAGVFNMTSGATTDTVTGNVRAEAGGYGLFRAQATLSGPLAGDAVTGRLSLGYVRRNGFVRHLSGGLDTDSLDQFSWRAALALKPSDRVTVTLRTDGLRDRGVPDYYSSTELALPGFTPLAPHQDDANRPNRLKRDIAGGSVTAVADLGGPELTSITAYRKARYAADLDDDQRQIDILAIDRFADRTRIWSEELRVSGKVAKALSYVAGVYFMDQRVTTGRTLALGDFFVPGFAPSLTTNGMVSTRSIAVFGNVDWRVTQRMTLSAGMRYTHERKRASFVQDDVTGLLTGPPFLLPDVVFSGRTVNEDVSPTGSLDYALAKGVNLYVRVARGFKSAAFNVDIATSPNGLTAGPEHATSYEGGVKGSVLDGRLDFAVSGFHTDYADLQVIQLDGRAAILGNAGRARINGFEAEVIVQPVPHLRLEGSAGYADARYVRFDHCPVPLSLGGGATDCAGNRLTGAPAATARGAAEYGIVLPIGTLTPRFEAYHQSSVYFDPTNAEQFRAGGRTLLNARLGFATGNWIASAWVENLTDKVYETYHDDRSNVLITRTTAYGAPRTWGISLAARF